MINYYFDNYTSSLYCIFTSKQCSCNCHML